MRKMDSVKAAQKRIAKKKQVYKPILDNPYTNESELWPRVVDHAVVLELLEKTILRPFKLSREMSAAKPPVEIVVGYDEIMGYLGGKHKNFREGILFVCNKDSTPSVLLSQVPIAAYMSDYPVTLVQLPRGALLKFCEYLQDHIHDGLLLVPVTDELDTLFVQKIKENVQGRQLKWLDLLKYKQAPVKLLRTTRPLAAKTKDL